MATTETRTGFRLPWSAEHRIADETPTPAETAESASAEAAEAGDVTASTQAVETESVVEAAETSAIPGAETDPRSAGDTSETAPPGPVDGTLEPIPDTETPSTTMLETIAAPSTRTASTTSAKRPTKFLADLTRAMQSAAEAERAEILQRFQADAKAFTDQINERSGEEATVLRKRADDDVIGIRDWSKAEIARIREETDERIADRKARLDREIEAHTARIENEIDRVKSAVDEFEADMSRFFEGLMNEDDPTSFAERATNLPEPPSLEDVLASADDERSDPVATVAAPIPVPAPEPSKVHAVVETPPAFQDDPPIDHEAPADTAATSPEGAVDGSEGVAPTATTEPTAETAEETSAEPIDPRVAALGLTPDFAAAEAEAFENADTEHADDGSVEEIPALDDDTIAARLAGLPQPATESADETRSTQVVVTGLVSVASIAGFKRHLSRLPDVRSVGVSSGPEGEFLFTVTHGREVDLHDTIPTLPGFAARITGSGDGVLNVSAHDPETDA